MDKKTQHSVEERQKFLQQIDELNWQLGAEKRQSAYLVGALESKLSNVVAELKTQTKEVNSERQKRDFSKH